MILFNYNQFEFWLWKASSIPYIRFRKALLTVVYRYSGKPTAAALIIVGLYDFIMKVAAQEQLPSHMLCRTHSIAAGPIITRPSLRHKNHSLRCHNAEEKLFCATDGICSRSACFFRRSCMIKYSSRCRSCLRRLSCYRLMKTQVENFPTWYRTDRYQRHEDTTQMDQSARSLQLLPAKPF